MWYDISRLLSYNKVFNFVTGNRGGGKTFNAKFWAINSYIKNGKHFVWVRRYKTELKKINKFFDDIKHLFPDYKLEVKGKIAYCNGEPFGYFIPLSTADVDKSVSFADVDKVIYDEFLIKNRGHLRYLPEEVVSFLDLFETVTRLRDNCRAIFIANNVSIVNPYYTYFKIKPDNNKRFNIYDLIAIEFYKNEEYINAKLQTRYGKLISQTDYGKYSIHNESLIDTNDFIECKSVNSRFVMQLNYNNSKYGVWNDFKNGKMYVSRKYDSTTFHNYSITTSDHQPNTLFIREFKKLSIVKRLIFAYDTGSLYFEDQQCKQHFVEMYSIMR